MIAERGSENYKKALGVASRDGLWRSGIWQNEEVRKAIDAAGLADLRDGELNSFAILCNVTRLPADEFAALPEWQEAAASAVGRMLDDFESTQSKISAAREEYEMVKARRTDDDVIASIRISEKLGELRNLRDVIIAEIFEAGENSPVVRMAVTHDPKVAKRLREVEDYYRSVVQGKIDSMKDDLPMTPENIGNERW